MSQNAPLSPAPLIDPAAICARSGTPWLDTLVVSDVVQAERASPGSRGGFVLLEPDPPPPLLSAEVLAQAQRGAHAAVEVVPLGPVGFGLFARAPLQKGALVAEYTGTVVDLNAVEPTDEYIIEYPVAPRSVGWTLLIDAGPAGGYARYVNHSWTPNCHGVRADFGGLAHILFITLAPVAEGEQLTISYGEDWWQKRGLDPFDLPAHRRDVPAFLRRFTGGGASERGPV